MNRRLKILTLMVALILLLSSGGYAALRLLMPKQQFREVTKQSFSVHIQGGHQALVASKDQPTVLVLDPTKYVTDETAQLEALNATYPHPKYFTLPVYLGGQVSLVFNSTQAMNCILNQTSFYEPRHFKLGPGIPLTLTQVDASSLIVLTLNNTSGATAYLRIRIEGQAVIQATVWEAS